MNNLDLLIPQIASKSLLYEATLHPKPGLVDPTDSGAHDDMNIYTFLDSIVALSPFFGNYYQIGLDHSGSYESLFEKLRKEGILAEKAMFKATTGINTHKGANFSFAVILGATGNYFMKEKNKNLENYSTTDTHEILEIVKKMTTHLITNDLKKLDPSQKLTHGEKLYIEKGRTGIRGEAAQGYPALENILLPFFRRNTTMERNILLLHGLILLMSEIEDANILHRGGEKAWKKVQTESSNIFNQSKTTQAFKEELLHYNKILKKRNLSPGGAADLLSLGIYFCFLEGLI